MKHIIASNEKPTAQVQLCKAAVLPNCTILPDEAVIVFRIKPEKGLLRVAWQARSRTFQQQLVPQLKILATPTRRLKLVPKSGACTRVRSPSDWRTWPYSEERP